MGVSTFLQPNMLKEVLSTLRLSLLAMNQLFNFRRTAFASATIESICLPCTDTFVSSAKSYVGIRDCLIYIIHINEKQ